MRFTLEATADALETRIRANRLFTPPVTWADELIYPAYDGLSLLNVPRTVADLLGAPLPGAPPLDPAVWGGANPTGQVERVIVILSDGLGYKRLRQVMAADPVTADAVADLTAGRGPLPLTTICPSTTSAALSTLWTGTSPAAHGMLSFKLYLREADTVAIPLFFRPVAGNQPNGSLEDYGLIPEEFVPVPGLAAHFANADIPTYAFSRADYLGSGLGRIIHRGLPPEHGYPHLNYADMWLRLRELLTQTAGQRCYVSVYWEAVDTLSHAYGADNAYVQAQIQEQMTHLRDLLADPAMQDGRTLVLFIADHGHHDALNSLNLKTNPQAAPIYDALRGLLAGEGRLPYLNLRSGYKQAVIDCIERDFPETLTWLDPADALAAGLFGPEPPYAEAIHRLGDLIVVPRLNTRLDDGGPSHPMISAHGGLSDWEMLIPLLWARL